MPSPKYNKIRRIVQLKNILRRWRIKSRNSATRAPSDVPAGHVALCVGPNCTRFVVRATYLNHPVFQKLLNQTEEEYGFSNNIGPLTIPCDEALFQQILRFVSRSKPNRVLNRRFNDDFYKPATWRLEMASSFGLNLNYSCVALLTKPFEIELNRTGKC